MQLTNKHWDIIVVGGGLAGSVMGLALRGYPGRVAVIDAAPKGLQFAVPEFAVPDDNNFDRRNITLSDSSRRIFNSLGIWSGIVHAATAVKTIHVSQKHAFGVTQIRADEEGLEALAWVIPYPFLLRTLQTQLNASANPKFFAETTVQSLAYENGSVCLRVREGDTLYRIKARLVILAEGGGDLLELAGFHTRTFDYKQSAIVTNIRTEHYIEHVAYERFTRHGILVMLPLDRRRYGVVWVYPNVSHDLTAAKVLAWDDGYFAVRLREDFGRKLGDVIRIGKRAAYSLRLFRVTKMVNRSIVALGNAAHTLHPVAGQSFNLTLRDIAFLAQYLFETPENPADDQLLDSWENSRKQDIQYVTAFTDFIARATILPFAPLFSGKALLTFDVFPSLRRAIIRRSLGLSPPVSRLASGLPLEPCRKV